MKLCFLDCETTGLDPLADGLIQVAGIIDIDGVIVKEFNFKCRPFKGDMVHKAALAVNGVKLEDLRNWPDPVEVFYQFKKVIDEYWKGERFYPIGQNVSFDLDFLRFWFTKNGCAGQMPKYFHYHKIDLLGVSFLMKIAGRLDVSSFKLAEVCRALGIGEQKHDALDDIRKTRQIFYIFRDWVKNQPPS